MAGTDVAGTVVEGTISRVDGIVFEVLAFPG